MYMYVIHRHVTYYMWTEALGLDIDISLFFNHSVYNDYSVYRYNIAKA